MIALSVVMSTIFCGGDWHDGQFYLIDDGIIIFFKSNRCKKSESSMYCLDAARASFVEAWFLYSGNLDKLIMENLNGTLSICGTVIVLFVMFLLTQPSWC